MTRWVSQPRRSNGKRWRSGGLALASAFACAISGGALASPAAQPGINWVRLDGAEHCPSAVALVERVEARMRELRFTSTREADLFVDGSVRHAAEGGWDVRLEVSSRDGKIYGRRDMHFDGEACAVIEDGVALVIAVTLYPEAGLANAGIPLDSETAGSLDALFGSEPSDLAPEESVPAPASAPPPAAEKSRPAEPVAPRARAEPEPVPEAAWHLFVDVAGFGAIGQLPGASVGVVGHIALDWPGLWPIEIGARVFREGSTKAQSPDKGRSRFELLLASIATCPWSPAWLPAFAVCTGVEAGRLRAESSGFAVLPPVENDAVANLLASGVWRVRFTAALHLRAAAAVVLPLIQHEYTYRSAAAERVLLYRMPQVGARVEIGAGMRF